MSCEYCDRPVRCLGLCSLHYQRLRKGLPLTAPPRYGGVVKWQMAHLRIRALWGPARQYSCVRCGARADEWAYDGTDPRQLTDRRGPYSLWPEFYMPMCVQHHRQLDLQGYSRPKVRAA